MGLSILELVLNCLREGSFHADVAYPGQKYPKIIHTVAAVHIEKMERSEQSVTVEVNIISPAALGGTVCEIEAMEAAKLLTQAGAECIQQGCRYDGIAQVYMVPVLATFTGTADREHFSLGPGFAVEIGGMSQPYVTSFASEQIQNLQAQYAMGETDPAGFSQGSRLWKITLEELIPPGSGEPADPGSIFDLSVTTGLRTESFYRCRFTSEKREYTRQGLRRVRSGVSMMREMQ